MNGRFHRWVIYGSPGQPVIWCARCAGEKNRPHRYGRVLRFRRTAGRPQPARQAGDCRLEGEPLCRLCRFLRSTPLRWELRDARLCPEGIFIPPDFTRYRAVSQSTREIFKRHTDLIEPLSLDEAYLDVTENKTGLATATRVARSIREQIREELHLTASAGVAPNKFLAKIASDWRKPDGLFVIQPNEVDTFLPPLPVGRIPGVGKVTEKILQDLGIHTVGDLRARELSALEARFGRYGVRLYELARGIDH